MTNPGKQEITTDFSPDVKRNFIEIVRYITDIIREIIMTDTIDWTLKIWLSVLPTIDKIRKQMVETTMGFKNTHGDFFTR